MGFYIYFLAYATSLLEHFCSKYWAIILFYTDQSNIYDIVMFYVLLSHEECLDSTHNSLHNLRYTIFENHASLTYFKLLKNSILCLKYVLH